MIQPGALRFLPSAPPLAGRSDRRRAIAVAGAPASSPFVVEILTALRRDRYTPAAWLRFLADSSWRSMEDAQQHPLLVCSWLRQSIVLASLGAATLRWHRRSHRGASFRAEAGPVTALLLLQQAFVGVHLGMTHREPEAPLFRALGPANFLSQLRGLCATLLWSLHDVDGPLFGLLITAGAGTDVLDGLVARGTATRSRLGLMLDPLADTCFYGTVARTAVRRGVLPLWLNRLTVARFLVPTAAGLFRYFGRAQPLEPKHSIWGKLAGGLLIVTVLTGSVRPWAARLLHGPTALLLCLASVRQVRSALELIHAEG